jgi:threonine dehydrogenase-like Zn-dependent dehydrogenase
VRSEAAVIHGRDEVMVTTVDLPEIGSEELLLRVVSSSMCLSTSKALALGSSHKRVPDTIAEVPVITGHEFAGVIEQVGSALTGQYSPGQSVAVQPAMGLDSGYSPGYSYPYYGGDATYCIVPKVAVDKGCVLPYAGSYFANASLAEPMSCIIGAFRASYHTQPYVYEHEMGIRKDGRLALLGSGGPMGVGAVDYALHGPVSPRQVVAVDADEARLQRLRSLFPPEEAAARGIDLVYLDVRDLDAAAALRELSEGEGFDDVLVLAASAELLQVADAVLATDGCLNFFAGPTDKSFAVPLNFYNVHYERTHLVGTSGGSRDDMAECLELSSQGVLNPSFMVTHVAGLDAVPGALRGLPSFRGGKIVVYPHAEMPLTGIAELADKGAADPRYARLAEICERHDGIWNEEAERYLLDAFARG